MIKEAGRCCQVKVIHSKFKITIACLGEWVNEKVSLYLRSLQNQRHRGHVTRDALAFLDHILYVEDVRERVLGIGLRFHPALSIHISDKLKNPATPPPSIKRIDFTEPTFLQYLSLIM